MDANVRRTVVERAQVIQAGELLEIAESEPRLHRKQLSGPPVVSAELPAEALEQRISARVHLVHFFLRVGFAPEPPGKLRLVRIYLIGMLDDIVKQVPFG